ncbi:MAG: signal peptide peptidase SppA [Phycisphaerales bacterium]|nr:MAG: signal peptide peptidase SppA [Phycisphaerales bacterium]
MVKRRSVCNLLHTRVLALFVSLVALPGCGPAAFQVELVPTSRDLEETRIQRDEGLFVLDKIAIIDVDGLMMNRQRRGFMQSGENPVSLFIEKLDKAAADRSVKAVVLRLNSPGGTVAASDIMHHSLREFKRKTGKPVIGCVLSLGCSGAYYLACGCDGIMAQPSSVTGNIGTVFQTISVAGTMHKIGVKAVTIKSGELKDLASPLHDLSEDERRVLEGIIEDFSKQFFNVVREGRKNMNEQKLRDVADGRVFTADQALEQGLIDKVGYLADGIEWAKDMAGVHKAQVVIYHRPLGYVPNAYGVATSSASGMGPLINVELPDWLNSSGAQFLYLWQPGIQ